jgi:hypothetical protein
MFAEHALAPIDQAIGRYGVYKRITRGETVNPYSSALCLWIELTRFCIEIIRLLYGVILFDLVV